MLNKIWEVHVFVDIAKLSVSCTTSCISWWTGQAAHNTTFDEEVINFIRVLAWSYKYRERPGEKPASVKVST